MSYSAILPGNLLVIDAESCLFIREAVVTLLTEKHRRGELVSAEQFALAQNVVSLADSNLQVGAEVAVIDAPIDDATEWISLGEAATELRTSRENVRKRCISGTLTAQQLGDGRWQVDKSSLKRLRRTA